MNTSESACIRKATNLDIFDKHQTNRPFREDRLLEESMKRNGFMPSGAIQCVRNGDGRLKVIRGHHRLHYARKLGLPVYYVIDDSNTDIFALESSGHQRWSLSDFIIARAQDGNEASKEVVAFADNYGLPIGISLALLCNQTHIATGNPNDAAKRGTVTIKPEGRAFAHRVGGLCERLRDRGVKIAKKRGFILALAMCCRYDLFEDERLIKKAKRAGCRVQHVSAFSDCLREIEDLYNFGCKASERVALAMYAAQATSARSAHVKK